MTHDVRGALLRGLAKGPDGLGLTEAAGAALHAAFERCLSEPSLSVLLAEAVKVAVFLEAQHSAPAARAILRICAPHAVRLQRLSGTLGLNVAARRDESQQASARLLGNTRSAASADEASRRDAPVHRSVLEVMLARG